MHLYQLFYILLKTNEITRFKLFKQLFLNSVLNTFFNKALQNQKAVELVSIYKRKELRNT